MEGQNTKDFQGSFFKNCTHFFFQVILLIPCIEALYGSAATPKPYGHAHAPVYQPQKPAYHPPHGPSYGYTPAPHPPYGQKHHVMPGHPPKPPGAGPDYGPPGCAKNSTQHYCLDDYEYPVYEIQHAVEYHYAAVAALYKDVLANTENSVDRLVDLPDEQTYLCGSYTSYVHPKRAINSVGQWRIIVNDVQAHYETLTQTARVEACAHAGQPCPLVPECYHTKCVQKFIYHRFLVYDPYDYYFPFAIESFHMPSACACYNGAYAEPYHKA